MLQFEDASRGRKPSGSERRYRVNVIQPLQSAKIGEGDTIRGGCQSQIRDVVVGAGESLLGMLTDGDLRRMLGTHKKAIFDLKLATVINRRPIVLQAQTMAVDALKFLETRERPLNLAPVVEGDKLVGLVRLHEFLAVA